ncbi:tRNA-2-methylthio-N(6)-dimethylallyladenosine synthase [Orchesella cincta]|uniref:tRNA-2-methylthio-N(6)-dimethylallyladenosine synthase n=1 Tax=Orchesella cincta TaxID=48709 RepID=A0A1D2MQQ8_ORCCI|nr:tRNA-2-methylthio-N(6)-dimethylallyladenosine synthase [Orchesella cincta]
MAGYSNGIPNGVKNGNGKRERMDQDDDQEFMPLSKRINNIHLSPERLHNGLHMHGNSSMMHPNHHPHNIGNGYPEKSSDQISNYQNCNGVHGHPHLHQQDGARSSLEFMDRNLPSTSSSNSHHQIHHNLQVPNMIVSHPDLVGATGRSEIEYRPSMNQSANPHYYESNRALFNLYIERQLRNNQNPHPNVFNDSISDITCSNNVL